MSTDVASTLIGSQFDWDGLMGHDAIPGEHITELLNLYRSDYDDVDRLYIDHETIGG